MKASSLCCLLATVSTAAATAPGPGKGPWQVGDPADHGLDSAKMEELLNEIEFAYPIRDTRDCFVMAKDGVIVAERYYRGDMEQVNGAASVTKSVASALVGMAVQDYGLDLDFEVEAFVDNPVGQMANNATLKNILTFTGGAFADPAGSEFRYGGGELENIPRALTKVSGMPSPEFAQTMLVDRLGLSDGWRWSTSNGEINVGSGSAGQCRDFLKIAQLWLNKGAWEEDRYFSEEYYAEANTASYPGANSGYGYLNWLNADGGDNEWRSAAESLGLPGGLSGTGSPLTDGPQDAWMGLGMFGQEMWVLPTENIVMVTMGNCIDLEDLNLAIRVWNITKTKIY